MISDEPGDARRRRVRAQWSPPAGPQPRGDRGEPDLRPSPTESLDALSGDWRIFQQRRGHRYSTDDLLTAWYGCSLAQQAGRPAFAVDLGCGIGSVLLLCAWRLPETRFVGIEAQVDSVALARRSARWNGADDRVEVREGDLRDAGSRVGLGDADLVTGSPPYLASGTATESAVPQRDQCRFERRGGVEAYWAAMATLLRPGGVAVLVHEWGQRGRVHEAAREAGLVAYRTRPVIFKEGREPFIGLFAARRGGLRWDHVIEAPLTIRTTTGERSETFRAIRADMGFPP